MDIVWVWPSGEGVYKIDTNCILGVNKGVCNPQHIKGRMLYTNMYTTVGLSIHSFRKKFVSNMIQSRP